MNVIELIQRRIDLLVTQDSPCSEYALRELRGLLEELKPEMRSRIDAPRDPVAKSSADLVTPKQILKIRGIANSEGINAEAECMEVFKCRPEALSRSAASWFIDHLQSKACEREGMRCAGRTEVIR